MRHINAHTGLLSLLGRGKMQIAFVVLASIFLISCSRSSPVENSGTGSGSSGPISGDAIHVLSNRADLVSGGDALIEVVLPNSAAAPSVKMSLNGKDVTHQFALRDNGRYMGLITDMKVGRNVLKARIPGGNDSSYAIVNYPNGGPIFSGPQLQPWTCQETAVDAQCNQAPVYTYLYKSVIPFLTLQPYDPAHPATDVANTTTDTGVTVPFIVRVETGYQDRDQYRIATLFQPGQPWEPWAPQAQWNHKLLISHGGSCRATYGVGVAPNADQSGTFPPELQFVTGDSITAAISRGYATMSTALNNNGHNCNIVLQAESLMMAKERVVENYGELRYSVGTGCSGGSITQQQVANAYPGIYQGITPQCSFPDSFSSATQVLDYHLLRPYFEDPSKWATGVVWTPLQWAAVEGNLLPVDAIISDIGFFSAFVPSNLCGDIAYVNADQVYNAETNPGGVRCAVPDTMINVFGPRPKDVWSENEKKLGKGFAGLAADNVGVQYGLASLQQGIITPDMFIDLNAKIGGVNVDIQPVAHRLKGDEAALGRAYRSGAINVANNLKDTAIISLTGPDPGIAHDAYRTWAIRARMDREQNGQHPNHLIWFGAVPIIGDTTFTNEAVLAMDRWLTAVEPDLREVPLSQKIAQNKPGDLHDRCTQLDSVVSPDGFFLPVAGVLLDPILGPVLGPILSPTLYAALNPATGLIVDPLLSTVCGINLVQTLVQMRFETPRMVAGDAITTDVNKCQLKPLNRADNYGVFGLSDAQWAKMQTLFPEGVCDYTQPGVGAQKTVPWLTYQDNKGKVIYGGVPLPAAPENSGLGLVAPAFRTTGL
ncbi:DUF6351 family protein [Stenotrophobium rhamnosiphilum]|uniref:DUF6351 domain-containing protein n=1 Tax=Stenotrophobium rhamnosiphilum TaxID=2029166 RepID=A0A2T5MG09_9GAMM|nr:DUF6351 family protein [Stenotrophobium rhamnosiphilum]PTU31502.1 hypothetical protein CJD38_09220 [Stenotrophobium rhamnosiphilum]